MNRLRMVSMGTVAGLLAAVAAGCIENTAYVTQERSDKIERFLLKKAPKPQVVLNAKLEDKVTLIGYDLKADEPKAGDFVQVTWYWKVHKEIGAGWRLFTHGIGDDGEPSLNLDKEGEVRKYFQPEHWRAGMTVKDVQRFRIPANWAFKQIELRTGVWKGSARLKGQGTHFDNANRIKGPRIKLMGDKKPPVDIPFTKNAPKIDGRFEDEAVWQTAVKLDPFVNTMNGKGVSERTDVRLLWDATHLYVAAKMDDENLQSRYTNHDDELWKEDAFEMFLDPKGDKKDYYELQINPKGVIFDSHLPRYRKNQNEWSSNMKGAVQLQGTFNDDSDTDEGWTVELAIPFASLTDGGGSPPKAGDEWRANFFRIDLTKSRKQYSAWSPPMRGDFHTLARFGHIVFKAPPGAATTTASEPGNAASAEPHPIKPTAETAPKAPNAAPAKTGSAAPRKGKAAGHEPPSGAPE